MKRKNLFVSVAAAFAACALPATVRAADPVSDPMFAAREALYGDVPLDALAANGNAYPWTSLRAAAAAIKAGHKARAIALLHAVAADPTVATRAHLEAWSGLRSLGVIPPTTEAAKLEGVVLDVVTTKGRETVAAYADTSAVYITEYGQTIAIPPGVAVRPEIDAVFKAGRVALTKIGNWAGPRPALPFPGGARVALLTAGGLAFGQGPIHGISRDRLAGPVFTAQTALLMKMIAHANGTTGSATG